MFSKRDFGSCGMSQCEYSQLFLNCPLKFAFKNVCDCNTSDNPIRDRHKIPDLEEWLTQSLSTSDCDIVFRHWLPFLSKLSMDPHANYLVQKLIGRVSKSILSLFIANCTNWDDLVCDKFSSRVVQKLATTHNGSLVPELLEAFGDKFCAFALDSRANYVAKATVENMPVSGLDVLIATVAPRAQQLSVSPHASYVLQMVLSRAYETFEEDSPLSWVDKLALQQIINKMLISLIYLGPLLFQHPHGNFTAQVMVGLLVFCNQARHLFMNEICDKIVEYASCPYGVRVLESVLEIPSPTVDGPAAWMKNQLIDRITKLRMREFGMCFSRPTHFLTKKLMTAASDNQQKMLARRMDKMNNKRKSGGLKFMVQPQEYMPSIASLEKWKWMDHTKEASFRDATRNQLYFGGGSPLPVIGASAGVAFSDPQL